MREFCIALLFVLVSIVNGADIESIVIAPENPTDTDYVTVTVTGICHNHVEYDYSSWWFDAQDDLFDVTLYFTQVFPEPVLETHPWEANIELGYISAGDYRLGVAPVSPDNGYHVAMDFTVTPEPLSCMLFFGGALLALRRR